MEPIISQSLYLIGVMLQFSVLLTDHIEASTAIQYMVVKEAIHYNIMDLLIWSDPKPMKMQFMYENVTHVITLKSTKHRKIMTSMPSAI